MRGEPKGMLRATVMQLANEAADLYAAMSVNELHDKDIPYTELREYRQLKERDKEYHEAINRYELEVGDDK